MVDFFSKCAKFSVKQSNLILLVSLLLQLITNRYLLFGGFFLSF